MRPTLVTVFGSEVSSFFFMVMLGALVGVYIFYKLAERDGLSPVVALDIGIISVVMGIIGARIFHILVEVPGYYWEDPIRVFYFWQGGFVSLGAYIVATLSGILYMKWRRQSVFRYADLACVAAPMVDFFVRLGCLLTGCCYGKPTGFCFHLIFTNRDSAAGHDFYGIPLHATQVYFMVNALLLFGFLWWKLKRRRFVGELTGIFLMVMGVSRFLIEFLRGDFDRGVYFNNTISTGQIVMVGFFAAGMVIYRWGRGRAVSPGAIAPS